MKLAFSVDALSAAGDHAWRLQQDGEHWLPCTYGEPLREGDAVLTDKAVLNDWNGRRLAPHKELGLVARAKPGMFDFLMRGIFAHVIPHRFAAPAIPRKEAMVTAVRGAAPGTPWLLYLDTGGNFRVLDSGRERIIGNLDIAVRGEIASSPDFIGPQAADNEAMMGTLYLQFLAGWCEHLQTHRMAVFVPDTEKLKEEAACREAIERFRPEG